MTYLEEKITQFRSMAAQENLTDAEIVAFLQELIQEGYGDSYPAMSIMDGLPEPVRHFMPAGFYVHKSEPNKKMRLISFDKNQGIFQVSKNSTAVMIIGLGAVTHVEPPDDFEEWNKVVGE